MYCLLYQIAAVVGVFEKSFAERCFVIGLRTELQALPFATNGSLLCLT